MSQLKQSFISEAGKRELVKAAGKASKKFKKDADRLIIAVRQEDVLRQSLMAAFMRGYQECLQQIDLLLKQDMKNVVPEGARPLVENMLKQEEEEKKDDGSSQLSEEQPK